MKELQHQTFEFCGGSLEGDIIIAHLNFLKGTFDHLMEVVTKLQKNLSHIPLNERHNVMFFTVKGMKAHFKSDIGRHLKGKGVVREGKSYELKFQVIERFINYFFDAYAENLSRHGTLDRLALLDNPSIELFGKDIKWFDERFVKTILTKLPLEICLPMGMRFLPMGEPLLINIRRDDKNIRLDIYFNRTVN